MTLLVSVFAAVLCTVIWYKSAPKDEMRVSILCWMFWGASLMWLVDAIFEFAELGAAYFQPAPADMLNDLFLGLSVHPDHQRPERHCPGSHFQKEITGYACKEMRFCQ